MKARISTYADRLIERTILRELRDRKNSAVMAVTLAIATDISLTTVYRALRRLERRGYVGAAHLGTNVAGAPPKGWYITYSGGAWLDEDARRRRAAAARPGVTARRPGGR